MPDWGFPVTAVSLDMLQCFDVIICKHRHIAFQLLIPTLPVTKRSIGHIIRDFQGVCEMVSWEPHSWIQNQEKTIFYPSYCHILKMMERLLILDSYRWNLGLSFWTGDKKQYKEWHLPQSAWKKTFQKTVSEEGYDHCPLGLKKWFLWMWCQEGRHSILTCIRMLARNQEVIQTSSSSLESTRNLASVSQSKASQVCSLGKSSENLVGQCYPLHSTTLFGAMGDALHGEYVWD